jgi:hypothetical protein
VAIVSGSKSLAEKLKDLASHRHISVSG